MRNNPSTAILAAVLATGLALLLPSCTTLNQKLSFKAIPSDLPVSASSSVLVDGKVVGPESLTGTAAFSTQKKVEIPLKTRESQVDIYPELKAAAAQNGGDAIVGLKVSIQDFRSSDYGWIGFERYMGGYFGIMGGAFAVQGLMYKSEPELSKAGDMLLVPGAIMFGAGAALFGWSYIHESLGKSVYTIGLEGQSVRISKSLD